MPINPTHRRAFHAVAAHGGFVRAAAVVGVSQPTLSEQVRALERAHGVLLFERHGRRAALTPLGERLHAISRRLFDLEAEAELCLTDAEQLRTGRLRVAADSPVYAMPLLAAVAERFPGIHTTLSTGNAGQVLRHFFSDALARTGLVLSDVLEVDSREAVLAAAAFGVGVGLAAEDELPADARLIGLRIDGLELTITEHLVCLAERRDLTVVRAACDLALSLA